MVAAPQEWTPFTHFSVIYGSTQRSVIVKNRCNRIVESISRSLIKSAGHSKESLKNGIIKYIATYTLVGFLRGDVNHISEIAGFCVVAFLCENIVVGAPTMHFPCTTTSSRWNTCYGAPSTCFGVTMIPKRVALLSNKITSFSGRVSTLWRQQKSAFCVLVRFGQNIIVSAPTMHFT
jgi:hypothetical protein